METLTFHDTAQCIINPDFRLPPDANWTLDGMKTLLPGNTYEKTFETLLHDKSLTNILEQRPNTQRNILDLYSAGYIDIYDTARQVVAVRLTNIDHHIETTQFDYRFHEHTKATMRRILHAENRTVLEGNLLTSCTWRAIEKIMDNLTIPSFDLILCRPSGPFETSFLRRPNDHYFSKPKPYLPIYLSLLNRAYRLLSPHNGILLTQIPEIPQIKELIDMEHRTVERLFNTIPGVHGDINYEHGDGGITFCIKLTKTITAPPNLLPYVC
jgi:hypothetical protein